MGIGFSALFIIFAARLCNVELRNHRVNNLELTKSLGLSSICGISHGASIFHQDLAGANLVLRSTSARCRNPVGVQDGLGQTRETRAAIFAAQDGNCCLRNPAERVIAPGRRNAHDLEPQVHENLIC